MKEFFLNVRKRIRYLHQVTPLKASLTHKKFMNVIIETRIILETTLLVNCGINFVVGNSFYIYPLKTMNVIKEGNHVLYIWDGELDSVIEAKVNEIKNVKNVQLKVENLQRITMGECFLFLFFFLLRT